MKIDSPIKSPALEFELPWPNKKLSPNARTHWAALAGAKSEYKRNAQLITANAILAAQLAWKNRPDWSRAKIQLVFCPPKNFAYDLDNALARLKSGIDGIANALAVDDVGFSYDLQRGEKFPPCGRVLVRVFV